MADIHTPKAIAERLRTAWELAGHKTRASFARSVDIPDATLLRWQLHGAVPKIATLEKVASALNVRVAWLLTGEGEMRPSEAAE